MSRRPNPGADRAAQNAQTLKALVKLEGNKVCADCKRNKHPRWASWNLGIFVCIRCSGIHRGMGTHISRVKSVDLDAWTDEQLQNVLKWGNVRANKYWEAKLAPGHVPSEAKIENFIRTKYDTKRWVMDGPMPDPATLGADDDVPLNIVQEKAKIERSSSLKQQNAPQQPLQQPRPAPAQNIDLFGDLATEPPVRPSTADIPSTKAAPPPTTKPKPQESLLGLDFFGSQQGPGINRPASTASNPAPVTNARGDLKNSILSLYASAPKPQPVPQQSHVRQPSLGAMGSPPAQQDAFGGLTDAFSGLSFPSNSQARSPPVQSPPSSSSAFSGLSFPSTVPSKATPSAAQVTSPPPSSGRSFFDAIPASRGGSAKAQVTSPPPLSGGSFFDAMPTKPASQPAAPARKASNGLDFAFAQKTSSPPMAKPAAPVPVNLFAADDGFDAFASAPAAPPPKQASPIATQQQQSVFNSPFNLTSVASAPKSNPAPMPAGSTVTSQSNTSMFDPWGSDNAWAAPEPAQVKPAAPKVELGSVPSHITPNDIGGGWGAPLSNATKSTTQPTVAADEDFGGWTSAPAQTPSASKPSGGGFGADPFDNPWG